jgi:hypothetical protein
MLANTRDKGTRALAESELRQQLSDRLAVLDDLLREVKQRVADKQEIQQLCETINQVEADFKATERHADEFPIPLELLRPHQDRLSDLYEAYKLTAARIQAFDSSLQVPLTLCAARFPQTKDLRRAIGELGLVRHYGTFAPWSKGVEVLTAARQLLEEICAIVSSPSKSAAPFPIPEGSDWADLEIRFLGDHRVRITVKHVIEYRNYAEMGLEDGRNHEPNKVWELLRTMAVEGSIRRPSQLKDSRWPAVEKQVERLGDTLRQIFALPGKPFFPYNSSEGYKPRFRISFPHPDQL